MKSVIAIAVVCVILVSCMSGFVWAAETNPAETAERSEASPASENSIPVYIWLPLVLILLFLIFAAVILIVKKHADSN